MSAEYEISFDTQVGRNHVLVDPDDPTTEYPTTAMAGTATKTVVTTDGVMTEEIPLMYEPGRERVSASRISTDGTTVTGAAHLRVMSGIITVERFSQDLNRKVDRGTERKMDFHYDTHGDGAASDLEGIRDQLAKIAVTALETPPGRKEKIFKKSLTQAVRPLGIPLTERR